MRATREYVNLQRYRLEFKKIELAIIWFDMHTSNDKDHCGKWGAEFLDIINSSCDFVYVLFHRFSVCYDNQEI